MSTYTVVTAAGAEAVTEAVRGGRTGGFVVPGTLGTTVLFDAPPDGRPGVRRLSRPVYSVACATGHPAWLLVARPEVALAVLVTPERRGDYLQWDADWHPAGNRDCARLWDDYCHELATAYGAPHLGPALAAVRTDPAHPLADVLRQVCHVFGLPDIGLDRPIPPAVRVDAHGRFRRIPSH